MKLKTKVAYGIAGLLAFMPLILLVIFQSIFALEASYDSKLVIDANRMTLVDIIIYDDYNNDITHLFVIDDKMQPVIYSIVEATDSYVILNFHGGKVDSVQVEISAIQFVLADGTVTKLQSGIVYLQFRNVAMTDSSANWVRDAWLREFINDMNELYVLFYKQPANTISYIWVKVITASVGTVIGLMTVLFVVLRKSTKALVRQHWRIAVLIALIEGTIIAGFISWLITDIFQVFAAAAIGWVLFLGAEKIARIKGYLDTTATGQQLETLPASVSTEIQSSIEAILAKFRK